MRLGGDDDWIAAGGVLRSRKRVRDQRAHGDRIARTEDAILTMQVEKANARPNLEAICETEARISGEGIESLGSKDETARFQATGPSFRCEGCTVTDRVGGRECPARQDEDLEQGGLRNGFDAFKSLNRDGRVHRCWREREP